MAKQFFLERRPHNGLTYEQYLDSMRAYTETADPDSLDGEGRQRMEYTKLNLHRSLRIERTYKVPETLCTLLARITEPQLWMVLTESWCGDSSQSLPMIAKYAQCADTVTLRILPRDENLDIMENYLTDGTRSIPILVIFDTDGTELVIWGPRPQPAAELFAQQKARGLTKEEIIESLQLWYGRDRGKTLEKEFTELFTNLVM